MTVTALDHSCAVIMAALFGFDPTGSKWHELDEALMHRELLSADEIGFWKYFDIVDEIDADEAKAYADCLDGGIAALKSGLPGDIWQIAVGKGFWVDNVRERVSEPSGVAVLSDIANFARKGPFHIDADDPSHPSYVRGPRQYFRFANRKDLTLALEIAQKHGFSPDQENWLSWTLTHEKNDLRSYFDSNEISKSEAIALASALDRALNSTLEKLTLSGHSTELTDAILSPLFRPTLAKLTKFLRRGSFRVSDAYPFGTRLLRE